MKLLNCFLLLMIVNPLFAQQSLKVMTYNIQGMKPGSNYETRLYHMIQKLKEIDPDMIGLQEINETTSSGGADNMAKTIADSLSAYFDTSYSYYYSITHVGWNQFYESVGVVSKHPVEQEGYGQLATGVFPRKVVWTYVNTPLGMINFFNTHLSYREDHNHIRVQQVQQIKEYIGQKETDFPGIATILTGDFNATPGSEPISLLTDTSTDTFYLDTYFEVNPTSAGFTITSASPNKRIDFIFYKNIGQLSIDTSLVVMDQPYSGNNYCSDHLGVITIFSKSSTGIENQKINYAPEIFKLHQNCPNPFNLVTTIKYELKKSKQVVIKVYNITGQEVTTLFNGFRLSGHHSIRWNADMQSSGIYYFRMITDGPTDTKKCLLSK